MRAARPPLRRPVESDIPTRDSTGPGDSDTGAGSRSCLIRLMGELRLPRAAFAPKPRPAPAPRLAWWLSRNGALALHDSLRRRGARPVTVRDVPCAALRFEQPALVPPSTWAQRCARQCSWMEDSDKRDLWLAVSREPLEELDGRPPIRITPSAFTAPRECGPDEAASLAGDPAYLARKPGAWDLVGPGERRRYLLQALAFGRPTLDFGRMFVMAGANHANFLNPRFTAEQDGRQVPYSIGPTAWLCSCCMELFGVLAPPSSAGRRMLVRPCPGAVRFALLVPDAYLQVDLP